MGDYRGREATGFVFVQENSDRLWRGFDLAFILIGFWRFVTWEIESGVAFIGFGLIAVEGVSDRVERIGEISGGDALGLEAVFLEALEGFKDSL